METTGTDAKTGNSSIPDSMLSSPDFVPAAQAEDKATGGDKTAGNGGTDASKQTDDNANKNDDASKSSGKEKNLDDRFDQHPRFQELNTKLAKEKEARIAAEAKIALLEKSPVVSPSNDKAEPTYKDISKMSAEELREWQEDDPIGYANNLKAIAIAEMKETLTKEQIRTTTVSKISETFDQYAKENPTFATMWESGEIEQYMKEHPGHNAISAHIVLTRDKEMQTKIDAAVAKATKETEERVTKNFQAKRTATIISQGSSQRSTADDVDPALKDTNKFGGNISVIAQRLAEQRRSSA